MKRWRMYTTFALLAALLSAIWLVPFPSRVSTLFELQPHAAASVYFEAPGRLQRVLVKPGDHVEKGQLLAELENLNLELAVEELRGKRDSLEAQIAGLEQLMIIPERSKEAAEKASVARENLVAIEEQLAKNEKDLEQLRLVAPRAGTVIPPPRLRDRPHNEEAELASWTGTPFDPENIGAAMSNEGPQNLFCLIGDPNAWEAVLVISQDDIDQVREGQEVRLMFEESAYHVYVSKIESLATDSMPTAPQRLASTNGGSLPAKADPDGTVRPLSTSYQAVAPLDNRNGLLRNGLVGRARIEANSRTIYQRIARYLSRTFNFDL